MSNFKSNKFSSTSLTSFSNILPKLIAAGLLMSPSAALASSPVTITNTAGVAHVGATNTSLTGYSANSADVGIKMVVENDVTMFSEYTTAISASEEDAGHDIAIILDANVSNSGIGVQASSAGEEPGDLSDVDISGSGNVTSTLKTAIKGIGKLVSIGGTGTTTTTIGNAAIYASGDAVTITRSGNIDGGTTPGSSGIDATAQAGDLVIGKVGNSIGQVTKGGDYSYGISMNSTGTGNVSLYTENSIINTGSGSTFGVKATNNAGDTNITVSDITLNALSKGGAIIVDNLSNASNATNISLNGTLSGGGYAVFADGNAAQATNITNNATGIINGAVYIGNSKTSESLFTNKGVWNIFAPKNGLTDFSGTVPPYLVHYTYTGKLLNSGTINAQNTSATDNITLFNGLELTSTSVLKVDVTTGGFGPNADESDKFTNNGGDVTLNGTLNVNAMGASSGYSAASGAVFTLVNNAGAGTTTGAFTTLTDNLAFLDLEVANNGGDGNDVTFKFVELPPPPPTPTTPTPTTPTPTTPTPTTPTPTTPTTPVSSGLDFTPYATGATQAGAANTMKSFDFTTPQGIALKAKFLGLTKTQAKGAIQQISGNDHSTANQAGNQIASYFQQIMLARANLPQASGIANKIADNSQPQTLQYTVSTSGEPTITWWAQALGSYSKVNDGNLSALTTQTFGAIGGAEYTISDNLTLGASLGYTNAKFSVANAGSSSKANNFHIGGSAMWGNSSDLDTGLGISGGVDITRHNYKTSRAINIGGLTQTADAQYTGYTMGGAIKARYGINVPMKNAQLTLSPFIGVDASRTSDNGFTETGAGSLNITGQASSTKKLGGLLGLGVATKMDKITASLSAGLRHEFGDVNQTRTNKLAGSPVTFGSTSPTEARNKLVLNASFMLEPTSNSSLTFAAFGEKSSTTLNLGASASYKVKF